MSVTEAAVPRTTDRLAALPRLGVGVLHNPSLGRFLREDLDALDYLAIIPDRFWSDEGAAAGGERFDELEKSVELLDSVAEKLPIVGHSVGLSIGSAELFDTQHVEQIARWQARYGMPWHSDHLSFIRMPGVDAHTPLSAGLPLPIP
ncbi:MAG TPA: DUF692 family protein, partial [Armatimonadota bacterium]|nr:DUF692 family protein [Armatimonadota bacterium]